VGRGYSLNKLFSENGRYVITGGRCSRYSSLLGGVNKVLYRSG